MTAPARCDHDPGCCVYCCPAEPDSNGTGEGCHVCRPATRDGLPAPDRWIGESQRDRDARAGFAVLFGDVNTCRRAARRYTEVP